jgi:hypothetical protein
MQTYQRFIPYILENKAVGKTKLRGRNLYKINSYTYSDGEMKTLSGSSATLIFCLGIYDKKLIALKISEMQPSIFFIWLKSVLKKGLKAEDFDKYTKLEDLCIESDLRGTQIFSSKVKNRAIYKLEPELYRTYNMSGIKNVEEIKLSPDILKKTYGIKESKTN